MACPQGPAYGTYWVRVPASVVRYVPRTVAPQVTTAWDWGPLASWDSVNPNPNPNPNPNTNTNTNPRFGKAEALWGGDAKLAKKYEARMAGTKAANDFARPAGKRRK